MNIYIKQQGKRINQIIDKVSRYADINKTAVDLILDYRDFCYLKKEVIKQPNNVISLTFIFDLDNFSISKVKRVIKNKSKGHIIVKFNKHLNNRIIRTINNEKLSNIEIVILDNGENISSLNNKNIICYKNYREIDMLSLICNLEERYGCYNSSCLNKRFYIDEDGNVSFCYKNESKIGNILNNELIDIVSSSQLFKEVLIKSINRRNKCKEHCNYFSLCKGGCVLDDINCDEFKKTYDIANGKFDKIKNSSFALENKHLSEENIILWYISRYHKKEK